MPRTSGKSEQLSLGDVSETTVARVVVQVVGAGWTGGLTPKARVKDGSAAPLVNVPYTNVGTNAPVAAGAAISADGIYEIDAPGREVVLDHAWTAGSVTIYSRGLVG